MATAIKRAGRKLLYLIVIPVVLARLLGHMIGALCQRFAAIWMAAGTDASRRPNGRNADLSSQTKMAPILPLPKTGVYLGDIFGYFAYLKKGAPLFLSQQSRRIGKTVFATNVGTRVVVCGDHKSAETLFVDVDNLTQSHAINITCTRRSAPLFTSHGPDAVKARQFIQSLLPQDETAKNFQSAMSAAENQMDNWTRLSERDLTEMKVELAVGRLIYALAGHLLIGSSLDTKLIERVFPAPNYLPNYPAIPPTLLPSFYGMQEALDEMYLQSMETDNWDRVARKATESKLSDREAFEQIFTALTFNAAGLSNPILNGLLLVSLMPHRGRELLDDDAYLTSFIWELLRHNGPTVMMQLPQDTLTTTAANELYNLRSGTVVLCNTTMAQRDATRWKDPALFRAKRFMKEPSGSTDDTPNGWPDEPLPTLGFGCPISRVDVPKVGSNMHQCPFTHLAPIFLKAFLRLLITRYDWRFDSEMLTHVHVLKNDDGLEVDFDLSHLRGGAKATEDMVPIMPKGMRFSGFSHA
ncbi:MAG: cytochrome P450 [Rhizobiaceae bacterium]